MSRLLLGPEGHPSWSSVSRFFDETRSLTTPVETTPGDRVVVWLSYEDLHHLDVLGPELATRLAGCEVLLVAPDLDAGRPLGQVIERLLAMLPEATRLLHAPPIEAVLAAWDDLRSARTLLLPLPESAIPIVAWQDVAEAIARWIQDGSLGGSDHLLGGPSHCDGPALASAISALIGDTLDPNRFVALRLRELDADGDGVITTVEAERFLVGLGHSPESAARIIAEADLDGDGTISPDEFQIGLADQLTAVLAAEPRDVAWHRTLPTILRDRWVALGRHYGYAHALTEHLAWPRSSSREPTLRGTTRIEDVLAPHVITLIDVFVIPGRGLLTRDEGRFGDPRPTPPELLWRLGDAQLDEAASFTHLATTDGLTLDTRRSVRGSVEARWRGMPATERLQYGGGDDARVLELADGRLVGLACRGRWTGLRQTMVDLMERRPIRAWERALFTELGALQLEHAEDVVDPQEVICNCVGVRRQTVVDAAEAGAKTLAAICNKTRATSICGGCTPLVEEILGSPRLGVAEVLSIAKHGTDFATVTLQPVARAPAPSLPGQHVVIQARIRDRWVTRAYSLTSPGGQSCPYEITVKREELGLFSRWLADRAGPDSLFRCSEPSGHIYLGDDEVGPVLAFGGGIGITPAIALARTLASDGTGRRLHVDWSVRRPTDLIFADELNQLAATSDNVTWTSRVTPADGRLTLAFVRDHYPFTEGAIAFICGPNRFADDVKAMLVETGWPESVIRVEVFTSKIDDDGNARVDLRANRSDSNATTVATLPPIQHTSFFLDLREDRPLLIEAEAFLGQMYRERGVIEALAPRLEEVREEVARTGTYTHTLDELTFGARLAWRNATRCVGRFFWNHLVVRDMRHLEREEDIFEALVEHIRVASNGGDLISTMTVFRPGAPDIRLYNTQLLRYAGYREADGSITGDPANVELTDQAIALGWRGKGTRFDILPLMVRIGDRPTRWFEIPEDAILRIPLEHPHLPWFAELGLEWYALPAVSEIALDLGGIAYRCTPFNGFYMATEIGARNFSDVSRYNLLPEVAQRMGLDTSTSSTLWKDRAMVELNVAVLHSFQKRGVRILDHHATCDYFLQFERQEKAAGREVHGDWSWLVPPMSGSASPLWFRNDLRNVVYKPMYGYQAHAWKADEPPPAHEGPIPPCPHMRGRR
jgi:nitric-oxide synthase